MYGGSRAAWGLFGLALLTQRSVLGTRPGCGGIGSSALGLAAEDRGTGGRAVVCWTGAPGRTSGLASDICVQVCL